MIKKKKFIIISVVAAVVLLIVGLVGSQAMADSGTSTTAPTNTAPVDRQKMLADKVASILGLDATTVENQFMVLEKRKEVRRNKA